MNKHTKYFIICFVVHAIGLFLFWLSGAEFERGDNALFTELVIIMFCGVLFPLSVVD